MTSLLSTIWSADSIANAKRIANALKCFTPPNKSKRVLICPPTTPGSIGDEAMVQALVQKLIARGLTADLLVISEDEDWSHIEGLSGFVALPRFTKNQAYLAQFNQYSHLYLIGADCLDGYYDVDTSLWLLWLCYAASLVCNRVTIVGFSFNKSPSPELKLPFDMLNRPNIRVNNRDPLSYERFKKFTSTPNHLTADAAFLLEPADGRTNKYARRAIGFNASPHSLHGAATFKEAVEHFSAELATVLRENKDLDIVLIPHDFRGPESDSVMLAAIAKKLNSNRVHLAHYGQRPAREIKQLVRRLDFVITGRMHLAIACLGSGVPVLSVAYQDKSEGLLKHFGLKPEELLVGPEEIMKEGTISRIVAFMSKRAPELKKQIADKLPHVLALSEANLQ